MSQHYLIRFFSHDAIPHLVWLQEALVSVDVNTVPHDTFQLEVLYDNLPPVFVEMTAYNQEMAQQAMVDFLEMLNEVDHPEKATVLNALMQTQSIITVDMPFAADDTPLVGLILDALMNRSEGLFHIASDGFYIDGEFLFG